MKIFISYSWKSPDNVAWVRSLIEKLEKNGFQVVIDRRETHSSDDLNAFMERIITDKEIEKVLIICDKHYKEAANSRTGGVGQEVRMIATDIVDNPRKYIAILYELDENKKHYVPAFLAGRKYVDFSKNYNEGYNNLLSELIGDDLRPPVSTKSTKLSDTEDIDNKDSNAEAGNPDCSHTTEGETNAHNSSKPCMKCCCIKYKGYFEVDIEQSSVIVGESEANETAKSDKAVEKTKTNADEKGRKTWASIKLTLHNITENKITSVKIDGTDQIVSDLSNTTWPRDEASDEKRGVVVTKYSSLFARPYDVEGEKFYKCDINFKTHGNHFCMLCLKVTNKTIYGLETVQLFSIVIGGDTVLSANVETMV